MPTPPPWWIKTRVAPDAQLRSAFRNGQSDTVFEPPRIASVSRLGEATETESRRGDIEFGAVATPAVEAAALGTSPKVALFLVQRATWNPRGLITAVRLTYAPGYRMHATL